jgi:hypothetical protein
VPVPGWSRIVTAVLAGVLAAVTPVTPAAAHQVGGMGATNYHATLTSIEPAIAGVSLRVVENGSRLELRNDTDAVVVVAGYSGEPYARIGPDGVQLNDSSPATVLNADRYLRTALPPTTDEREPPAWRQVSEDPVWRWHDHRVHWSLSTLPPTVADAPDQRHRVRDWTVSLWYGEAMTPMTAVGTLDWVPGPSPWPWFTLAALLIVGVVLLALLRAPHRPLAGAVGVFLAAYLLHGFGVMVAVAGSVPQRLSVLFGAESFLVWPFAILIAVLLWRRHTWAAWLAAGLGLVVASQVYRGDAAAWWSSSAPTALPSTVNRLAVALVVGLGAGLVVALPVLLRRQRPGGHNGAAARSGPGAGRPSSVLGSRLQAAATRSTSASPTSTSASSSTSAGSPT